MAAEVTWPNHFRFNAGQNGSYARFGPICSVTPICIPGEGHTPRINVHFRGGVSMDFDTATATELARRLPEAIAALPVIPNVSGALVDLGEPA